MRGSRPRARAVMAIARARHDRLGASEDQRMVWALSSRIGRRMAAALALSSFLPLAAFALSLFLLDSRALPPGALRALTAAGLVAAACTLAGALYLARRYVPALRSARDAIAELEQRRLAPPRVLGAD